MALAGLAADAIGYRTSVTDRLPGHLKNLQQHPAALEGKLEAVGPGLPGCFCKNIVRRLPTMGGTLKSSMFIRFSITNDKASFFWKKSYLAGGV